MKTYIERGYKREFITEHGPDVDGYRRSGYVYTNNGEEPNRETMDENLHILCGEHGGYNLIIENEEWEQEGKQGLADLETILLDWAKDAGYEEGSE